MSDGREQLRNLMRKAPAEPTASSGYDPSDHTVADVQTYVDAHPDELDDILAAEQAGKNRTTLVAWLEGDEG